MVTTKSMIDEKIEQLEKQLKEVKGQETEKYARIVGYYRAVKNWNRGKKEEFKFRVNFTETEFKPMENGTINSKDSVMEKSAKVSSDGDIVSYKFFYRTTCPNCPPVKTIVDKLKLEGESINADSTSGFTKAAIFEIFTAPTVIFLDKGGVEVKRASNATDLKKILKENNIK